MHTFKTFLAERSLTDDEKAKAEKIVKGMKKEKAGFQDRYGDKAKSVMYATATKLAKEEVVSEVRGEPGCKSCNAAGEARKIHAYHVHHNGKHIDTVFYNTHEDPADVKKSLVNHDGYHPNIKVVKEEVQIDELSKSTLKNYTKKALDSIRTHAYISGHHDADNMYGSGSPKKKHELTGKSHRYYMKSIKRGKGVQAAVNRLTKEETQINELKTDTMKKYIQTAADDLRHQAGLDAHYKRDFGKKPGPTEKKLLDKKHRKVSSRLRGIKTAADRIAGRSDWD